MTKEDLRAADVQVNSVSELLSRVRQAIEGSVPLGWVHGEVSGFKRAASGHCYFDLKDERAQIACVLYRNRAALVPVALRDGMAIECRVQPTVYEPRGTLQCTVEQVRLAGVGRLYEQFLRLKAKLEAEGLFAEERKRPLPAYPRRIGLITSPQAAALQDLLRVLRDRWPLAEVILYPASVQGALAPGELLAALAAANARAECEVLIIGRGGGSLEDLWAFNDEALVRAVAASKLPIVSAVGHESDVSLTDFAADLRAPTPSAAAAAVTPDRREVLQRFQALAARQTRAMQRLLETSAQRLDRAGERLVSTSQFIAPWRERLLRASSRLHLAAQGSLSAPRERLLHARLRLLAWQRQLAHGHPARQVLATCASRLRETMAARLREDRHRLERWHRSLQLLDPQQVLERGYAIVLDGQGQAVTDAARLTLGEALAIRLRRGGARARVERIETPQPPLES